MSKRVAEEAVLPAAKRAKTEGGAAGTGVSRTVIKFTNCQIVRHHKLVRDDLWVRGGKVRAQRACAAWGHVAVWQNRSLTLRSGFGRPCLKRSSPQTLRLTVWVKSSLQVRMAAAMRRVLTRVSHFRRLHRLANQWRVRR
jgi:hypothetical protein